MLCSISTASKPASNWLDRLRSSKGFPAGNDLDLEQFLNHPNPNHSDSSDTNLSTSLPNHINAKSNSDPTPSVDRPVSACNAEGVNPNQNRDRDLFGIVSNVLAELFNMGGANNFPRIDGKRSSRKQPNPRICILSTTANVDDDECSDDVGREEGVSATLPSSGDNSCAQVKRTSDRMGKGENVDVGSVDVEEGKSHTDLSAFSRTEVTVIDTSCASWKSEKLLFRKKNVWKVRDRKCRSMNINRRKRRMSRPDDEHVNEEKKPKRSVGQCSSEKGVHGEEFVEPSNEGHPPSNRKERAYKETSDILSQAPKKRNPRMSKKGGSSVILIKSVPTNTRNGANVRKSCLKLTQRQYKVP